MKNFFKKIIGVFIKPVVYNEKDLEILDEQIRFTYEKMITAYSFKEQHYYLEELRVLDRKYQKVHNFIYS